MRPATHSYAIELEWTGNLGTGTSAYSEYSRQHVVRASGCPELLGSSDPSFRGDATRWNPEQLLVAALSQCHLLWYLHWCAERRVIVEGYHDAAQGSMELEQDGGGQFVGVTLKPTVTTYRRFEKLALELHFAASKLCFIARSVNFPVRHEPTCRFVD